MKVTDAKAQIVDKVQRQIRQSQLPVILDEASPDPRDPGKFTLQARTARAIHRYDGWHVPIRLSWFAGSDEPPRIKGFPFYWYAFAIPKYAKFSEPRYFICDYLQIKEWVLDFDAPLGNDHRDHDGWRADIQLYGASSDPLIGYFRWGDESMEDQSRLRRVIRLDNIAELIPPPTTARPAHSIPESEPHLLLKHYVAAHPQLLGLQGGWAASIEHPFKTADTVDILLRDNAANVAVVEIELDGESNLVVGAHQAIKYRSLAASHEGLSLTSPNVKAYLVAFETNYPEVVKLCTAYSVQLVKVPKEDVFR